MKVQRVIVCVRYGRRYPIKRRGRVKNGVQGSSPCLTTTHKPKYPYSGE